MTITKSQLHFIINSSVEELVVLLQEEFSLSIVDALDKIYNSRVYSKLIDTRTGLYLQSAEYIYEYLREELLEGGIGGGER